MTPIPTTSISLLERLRRPDDQEAWARFVRLYTPLLHSWASKLGLQDQDANDVVQELLVVLIQKLPEFEYDPGKSFRGWLRTVLNNKWRDRCQRRQPGQLDLQAESCSDSFGADPIGDLEEKEYRRYLVGRALQIMQAEFQPATWKACWAFVVEDRPAADVAREIGITINAVYHAKSRILSRLRQELQGLLD